ncbi:MAG: ion channel [archaeon]
MIKKIAKRHLDKLSKAERLLYSRPLIKVPLVVVAIALLIMFSPALFPGSPNLHYVSFILILALNIYLLFFIIFLLKHSLKSLLLAKNLWSLLGSYAIFMIAIITLFSFGYKSVEDLDKGYLTYGSCGDRFDLSMMQRDTQRSSSQFYFSAVTLFTVGYGDICPMGWSKGLALINAFVGNFISVVLMVIVITAYLNRKPFFKK